MRKPEVTITGSFQRGVRFVLEHALGTVIGAATLLLLGWFVAYSWSLPKPITFDFQAEQRCPNGKLTTIQKRFADQNIRLTNGADRLTICDTEALKTVRSEAPRDLAAKYKGCLRWDGRELIMLRGSESVCELPGEAGYICDGAKARNYPGPSALGIGQKVPRCSTNLLRQLGFAQ
ncbi:hypothetical protein [Allomesorhizobium alhagi]|uniref:Transmembrane protein n=1 Tax=Mesorhizobium alhagi CCNWXJ12-2 TaxID=1107882 RepID=H0HM90_9HYPH|nr:hypothetical protein [Mesorhizobium alhagi]EHK58150.1 hypothetical protein MAXJ12_06270 [Mesorhizobium alhagi CCNWXJ12-2]